MYVDIWNVELRISEVAMQVAGSDAGRTVKKDKK